MRFVIVDLEGASRDYFSQRPDVVEALQELETEQPGTAADFYVVSYDAGGLRIAAPERGDEVLALAKGATKTYWYGDSQVVVVGASAETERVSQDLELVGAGKSPAAESA